MSEASNDYVNFGAIEKGGVAKCDKALFEEALTIFAEDVKDAKKVGCAWKAL